MARRISQYVIEVLTGYSPNLQVDCSNTFALVSDFNGLPGTQYVSNTFAMSADTVARFGSTSFDSTLAMTFTATGTPGALSAVIVEYMPLDLAIRLPNNYVSLENVLNMVFTASERNVYTAEVIDYDLLTNLQMRVFPHYGTKNETLSHMMYLNLVPSREVSNTASNTFAMTFAAHRCEVASNTFALSVALSYGQGSDTVLDMTSTWSPQWIGTRNVSNTFDLLSTFGFWNPSTDICSYNPFILSTSEVPAVGPTLTLQDTVTFTNAAEPSDSITLRAPRLADRRATQVTRVYRTNLVGNIINYADPQWPYSELLTLEFEALTAAEADLFYAFLESTLGKLVTYLDYYGREWSGLIMTPNAEFYQVSRSDCTFGTSIQFDGQLS